MFWTHAETPVGTVGFNQGTGTHGDASLGGTEELANRYFDLDPEYVSSSHRSFPAAPIFPILIWRTLPDPPPDFRYGIIAGVEKGDAELVVPIQGNDFGLLDLNGEAQLLEEHLGPALRTSLQDSTLVWASAAEPSPMIGLAGSPSAIALTSDGLRIAEQVTATPEGQLLGMTDRGVVGALAALAQPDTGRSGFLPVFARSIGMVFLVGGNSGPQRFAGDIVRTGLDGRRSELAVPTPLGHVLAAAYSFRTQSLYILDRVATHGDCDDDDNESARMRLIRVDAFGGGGEIIRTWHSHGRVEHVWLGSDTAGNMIVSASLREPRRHVIFHFNVDDRAVRRLLKGPKALAAPALVDANGMVIYTGEQDGTVQGVRIASPQGPPEDLSALESLL